MAKKEIVIIDKLVIGYNHIVFNAAIVSMIAEIYNTNEVVFIAESVHTKALLHKIGYIQNLTCEPYLENILPLNNIRKLIPWITKKIGDILFIKRLYKSHIESSYASIFTCLSSSTLLYAGYKARRVKTPTLFFLHGEIEYLLQSKIGFFNKIRAKIYNLFLTCLGTNSKILVFSEITKQKLVENQYLPADKVMVVEHPIIPTNYPVKVLSTEKIVFGHIGLALVKKSSALFFELAQMHSSVIANGTALFRLVGKIEHALVINDVGLVEILSKGNESLNQTEYEQNIALIDYAIFTFNEDNYVYRESGSVMDAIAFSKPIVALKHSYFNYLFNKAGNIGFLCNNMEELNLLVGKLIHRDEVLLKQYEIQQTNLKKLMKKRSVEIMKNKLSAII
jgi:hypothetical protein